MKLRMLKRAVLDRRRQSPLPPGLVLALESRSLSHLSPGDPVGSWPDLSGTGHHAVNATTSQKPTFRRSGSLPTVEFDGVDDNLDPSLLLGSSLTFVYVSIPVADYGALNADNKGVTTPLGGARGYNGAGQTQWSTKWELNYPTGPKYTGMGLLAVGVPYMSAVAVDQTGYASFYNRNAPTTIARSEAINSTVLKLGGSANHQLACFYAWARRLSTPEYQQVYDYVRGWMAQYGAVLP